MQRSFAYHHGLSAGLVKAKAVVFEEITDGLVKGTVGALFVGQFQVIGTQLRKHHADLGIVHGIPELPAVLLLGFTPFDFTHVGSCGDLQLAGVAQPENGVAHLATDVFEEGVQFDLHCDVVSFAI